MLKALLIVAVILFSTHGFANDTITVNQNMVISDSTKSAGQAISAEQRDDDDFTLFLFAFALAAMCFIAGCFFLGVLIAVIIVLLTIFFISAGIISTSIFIGWYKRSFSTGFRLFWMISGTIVGLVFGSITFGVVSHIMKLDLSTSTATTSGAVTGALTGLMVGYMIYKLLRVGFKLVAKKYKMLKDKLLVQ